MNTIYVMVGISYSGKSTYAERISQTEGAKVIATDDIRKELFGDETIQEDCAKVFNTAYHRVLRGISDNYNVVFDATNLTKADRSKLIKYLKTACSSPYKLVAVYCTTPDDNELDRRMVERARLVKTSVLENQKQKLSIPTRDEGYDEVWEYDGHHWKELT